jgi:hypothetical protein
MIDMHELDDIEKELALYKFKYEMAIAEKSIKEEGTVSEEELAKELGVEL